MDVNGVSVGAADTSGKVAVAESATSTDAVGVAVSPVSVIRAGAPKDVGAAGAVLLSKVVIAPPRITLAVLLGGLPGADVITIGSLLEAPPVGAAAL